MTSHFAKSGQFALTIVALALLAEMPVRAQAIPAAAPTAMPAPPPKPAAPAVAPTTRARLDFNNRLLTINADNSSLNQILRDISHLTGMTITGGVTDERVFGTYGPSDLSTILSSLLNGTGSNMLLTFDAARAPRELILTPRMGGPTPPNPNAVRDENRFNDLPPQQNQRMFNRDNPQAMQQLQQQPAPPQFPAIPAQPPAAAQTAPTDSATTTQQSPNGVRTPQQIYDDLVKLQQTKPPL